MVSFKNIHFEIVGKCNASCPYCVTGAKNNPEGKIISVELFNKAISKLCKTNIIAPNARIALYNWGEPFLHPDISSITEVINQFNLKSIISTNASKIPNVNSSIVKNLADLYISMSGFSQDSYNRIHKLNFQTVKNNITELVHQLRLNNYKGSIVICYHLYQFNLDEIKTCKEFAKSLKISFYPYYAYLNEWKQMTEWIKGKTPKEKLQQMSEDLFLYYMRDTLNKAPINYKCPQFEHLSIDEEANIITCCSLHKNHPDYLCGNIISDNIEETIQNKYNKIICTECSSLNYPYIVHNIRKPDFYNE